MGSFLSKVIDKLSSFRSSKPTNMLMLGLDEAGKTTILYKLKLNQYVKTVPTIGYNVETVDYKDLKMTIWDIGGQKQIRGFWKFCSNNNDALIFVIDSFDEERLSVAQEELFALLKDELLSGVPLLIFANKQDMGKMKPEDIEIQFQLETLKRPWKVQGTCAISGNGLYEGLDWLSQEIGKPKKKDECFANNFPEVEG